MSISRFHASLSKNPTAEPRLREACGVFGVVSAGCDRMRDVERGLLALQHRGQDAAGITWTSTHGLTTHKGSGLVRDVFRGLASTDLDETSGLAMGHVRYATSGSHASANVQPFQMVSSDGPFALAHNGHLTNSAELRRLLARPLAAGGPDSDSELLAHLLSSDDPGLDPAPVDPNENPWFRRLARLSAHARGAWSIVVLTADALFATRDPLGLRPLHIGRRDSALGTDWFVASESCAFDAVGARFECDVQRGEIVCLTPIGPRPETRPSVVPPAGAFCAFEYVYFARPDSLFSGRRVVQVRESLGQALGRASPVTADIVVGVPDSALPAARGYAEACGIPLENVFIRNHYVGRSFIEPTSALRDQTVRLKFSVIASRVAGLRVVLVDDSLVRGTTAMALVRLLREAGAREVHVRVASPPIAHPCYMGVDIPDRSELAAVTGSADNLAERLGASSLAYLSHDALVATLGTHVSDSMSKTPAAPETGLCTACFSGCYPVGLKAVAPGR